MLTKFSTAILPNQLSVTTSRVYTPLNSNMLSFLIDFGFYLSGSSNYIQYGFMRGLPSNDYFITEANLFVNGLNSSSVFVGGGRRSERDRGIALMGGWLYKSTLPPPPSVNINIPITPNTISQAMPTSVPETGSLLLMSMGLIGLGFGKRKISR